MMRLNDEAPFNGVKVASIKKANDELNGGGWADGNQLACNSLPIQFSMRFRLRI